MAETRAQATLKEAVVREAEEALGSRLDQALKEQNQKIDKNIADMFEVIRLIADKVNQTSSEPPVVNRSSPSASVLPDEVVPTQEYNCTSRNGMNSNYSGVTRLAKLDFPRFDGDRVMDWLFKVEQFFSLDHTPDELKVKLSSIHFDGSASAWHRSLCQTEYGMSLLRDWKTFKLLLQERFAEILDDPIADLKQLQETGSILEYHEQFELVRMRVNLPEEYLVSSYLAGLRTDTQMHIRMFQPHTVRQCFLLGRLYEKAHPRKGFANHSNNFSKGLLPLPVEKDHKLINSQKQVQNKVVSNKPRPFLSQEEMSDRRAKGLCYFCDEKYTPEHYMKHKKTQLFMMELDEEIEEVETQNVESEEEKNLPQISLNAVSGFTFSEVNSVRASTSKVTCCHFSSDGKMLASAGHDKKAVLWHTDNMKPKTTLEEHTAMITDIRFSPSLSRLATSSFDKTVRVWDADNKGYSLRTFMGHSSMVTSLDFHPIKDDLICSCDIDNEIRYWSINNGSCTRVYKGGSTQMRFQPRVGKYLAASSANLVNVLDVETQAIRHSLQGHANPIKSVCWDPSGDFLASVSEDMVKVWTLGTGSEGECVHELRCNWNKFQSCVFHPAYPSLLVIGCYQSLELWNMSENKTMTLPAHEGLIASLAVSTATGLVASASHDKLVKLWK